MLRAAGYHTTVIDFSSKQLDMLAKFGVKVYFGDATRPDMLISAGIAEAKLFVIAIDDKDQITELVRHVTKAYPNLHVIARAVDRNHVYDLWAAGCRDIIRETYDSSTRMGRSAFQALGATLEQAEEMRQASVEQAQLADIFVATAAVADWRPAETAEHKIKKDGSGEVPHLAFVENPDILSEIAHSPRAQSGELFCVGFAAESQDLLANAQAKRARKGVPLLVGNIGPATFGRDDNALLLVDDEGASELPHASKRVLAQQRVAEIARRVSGLAA